MALYTSSMGTLIRPTRQFRVHASFISIIIGIFSPVPHSVDATQNGPRGWGSSWTVPHTAEEKTNREMARQLQAALRARDWSTADQVIAKASQRSPKSAYIPFVRSVIAMHRDRYDDALADANRALELLPKGSPGEESAIYVARSRAYQLKGAYRAGRADLERAIAFNKGNLVAQKDYAWLLATCPDASVRDGRRAVGFARRVNNKTENKVGSVLDTLAAAEAEKGDFQAAVRNEQRAVAVEKGSKRDSFQKHLQVFQSDQPLRIPAEPPDFQETKI